MPRIYTLQQKRHALWLFEQLGSTQAASAELQIPERTLRDWVRDYRRGYLSPAKNPVLEYQGKPTAINLTDLRDRVLEQIDVLTRNPSEDPRKAYFASLTVNRLLEQVRMLNNTIDIIPAESESTDDP
jgi:transposase-like protein